MNKFILAALASSITGCAGAWRCDPDHEIYDVDRVITQGDLDEEGDNCEHLCKWAYRDETDWLPGQVLDCTLDVTPQEGADPATVVGTLVCTIEGSEGLCL